MGRRLAENKASSTESQPLVKWVKDINLFSLYNFNTRSSYFVTWFVMVIAQAMPQLSDRTKLPNIVDPVIKDTMDLKHLYQVLYTLPKETISL